MYPSVWSAPDADPARGFWVTLAFDAEDEAQALVKFESQAVALAETWRKDIGRADGDFTCDECLRGDANCDRCGGGGYMDRAAISAYTVNRDR